MKGTRPSLTPAEWNVMECLWERAPRTGREAIEYLEETVGWSRSTTLTLLRRMSEKGLIDCADRDGIKVYSPCVCREDAAVQETEDFLSRVYHGSISLMMSSITKKQDFTKAEIDELYAILKEAEKNGGE